MATVITFPFDAVDGSPSYGASTMREILRAIVKNGYVRSVDNELQVVASSPNALTVEIKPGAAWINGALYKVQPGGGNVVLSVPANQSGSTRLDYVVLRLDLTLSPNTIEAVYRTGTSTPPPLMRTSTQYELALAQVSVPNGATAISQNDITDTRNDANLCGPSTVTSAPPIQFLEIPGFAFTGGTVRMKYVSAQTDYSPPAGYLAAVLRLYNGTAGIWTVQNANATVTYAQITTGADMALTRPILLSSSQTIRLPANTGLTAIEYRDSGTITPVQAAISTTTGYTVPTDKLLVITRVYTTATLAYLYDQAAGTSYRYGSYVTAFLSSSYTTMFGVLQGDIQMPEDPQTHLMFVPAGREVRASASAYIMGYLLNDLWTFGT